MSKKIFFVVGHKRWGKSTTIKESRPILPEGFRVRAQSNDDKKKEWHDYIKKSVLDDPCERVVLALCPTFGEPATDPTKTLNALKEAGYRFYFWVLMDRYTEGLKNPRKSLRITHGEIEALKKWVVDPDDVCQMDEGNDNKQYNSIQFCDFVEKKL
jgi:hypothetical protein